MLHLRAAPIDDGGQDDAENAAGSAVGGSTTGHRSAAASPTRPAPKSPLLRRSCQRREDIVPMGMPTSSGRNRSLRPSCSRRASSTAICLRRLMPARCRRSPELRGVPHSTVTSDDPRPRGMSDQMGLRALAMDACGVGHLAPGTTVPHTDPDPHLLAFLALSSRRSRRRPRDAHAAAVVCRASHALSVRVARPRPHSM